MNDRQNYLMQKDVYQRWESYQYFELYIETNQIWQQNEERILALMKMSPEEVMTLKSFTILAQAGYHLPESRILKIDEDLLPIIEDTKPDFSNLKMKYPAMFINQKIYIGDNIINGFLVIDSESEHFTNKYTFNQKGGIRVLAVVLNTRDEYEFYMIEPLEDWKLGEAKRKHHSCDSKEKKEMRDISKRICKIACNLINLIVNDTGDIDFVELSYSEERNIKRAKRNKPPMRDHTILRVGGTLKRYAQEYKKARNHINVRYHVGGFWRRFRSPRFVNKIGQKVWVMPHYRGMSHLPKHVTKFVEVKRENRKGD
jgi:hypothetical protein